MYDVQAINSAEERHQRALDAVFGPETRSGHTPSPSGQPFHPANDGQAPAPDPCPDPGPAPAVMPYEKVYGALLNDPEVIELFRDHWDDTLPKVNMGPMPGDPAGQLRWFGMREVAKHYYRRHRHDFEDAKKHRVRERVEQLFRKLEQTDPLFGLTIKVMDFYIRELPTSLQNAMRRKFTRCPNEVLQFYQEVRGVAEHVPGICHERKAKRSKR
jgi:hypothetical protein